jgi:CubicO group peptidase (beta-lactamase class C family)
MTTGLGTLALALLTASGDAQVNPAVAAINEPGCPRLFDMLTQSFQKRIPKDQWPRFCNQVGKLEQIKRLGEDGGWIRHEAQTPSGPVAFDIAFAEDGRIAGLSVKPRTPRAPADFKPAATLAAQLQQARDAHHLPGVAALALRDGKPLEIAALGDRKLGEPTPVTTDDVWHLGSDTKAMTATLIAMLVDEQKLNWTATLPKLFPKWTDIAPGYSAVSIEMLLGHRAGMPAETAPNERFWKMRAAKDQLQARTDYVHEILRIAPDKVGMFRYSNASYVTAGVIVEQATGASWEVNMRKRLFEPLGMASCGFGPPAQVGKVDQPWAHDCSSGTCKPVTPGPSSDNPPALGPAGTVHCSLADWGKFVAMHVRGERGEKTLVSTESMKRLHQAQAGGNYAMGWGVVPRDWAGGPAWSHTGSNGMFFASVWAAPAKGLVFLSATNRGGDEASAALDEITQYFVSRYAR